MINMGYLSSHIISNRNTNNVCDFFQSLIIFSSINTDGFVKSSILFAPRLFTRLSILRSACFQPSIIMRSQRVTAIMSRPPRGPFLVKILVVAKSMPFVAMENFNEWEQQHGSIGKDQNMP